MARSRPHNALGHLEGGAWDFHRGRRVDLTIRPGKANKPITVGWFCLDCLQGELVFKEADLRRRIREADIPPAPEVDLGERPRRKRRPGQKKKA